LSTPETLPVVGDPARLRQVLDNLLGNVRAHTPPRAPAQVTLRHDNGRAFVEVADSGPGLPPEEAARVFERFYRADASRSRDRGGSGLGLAIVAAIAEAHGGRARVESRPGSGARFTVSLPAPAASAQDPRAPAHHSRPAPEARTL
jgi:two-component system OmpR family sensor kinase